MDWTVYIAPKGTTNISKYETSADKAYWAKVLALLQYAKDIGSTKTPTQLLKEVDIRVKCHTDGRLVDYKEILQNFAKLKEASHG